MSINLPQWIVHLLAAGSVCIMFAQLVFDIRRTNARIRAGVSRWQR